MKPHKSFAEIVAEAKAEPLPAREVRPGGYSRQGEFFDPSGHLLTKTGQLNPSEARALVLDGAQLAFEGCGCGGWSGCLPDWTDSELSRQLAEASQPRLLKSDAPTWLDLWENDAGQVVYAHGDVRWGDLFA